jgi:hypothetical protein
MPTDLRTGVLVVGAILLLAAVLSGTFKLFGAEIPTVSGRATRVAVGLFGVALILWVLFTPEALREVRPESRQTPPTDEATMSKGTESHVARTPSAAAGGADGVAPKATPTELPHPDGLDLVQTASAAFLACAAPIEPERLPDGANAPREQMIAAHNAVKAFDSATGSYNDCLKSIAEQLTKQYGGVASQAALTGVTRLHAKLHNAAVDRDEVLANRFNEELRAYKARSQSP